MSGRMLAKMLVVSLAAGGLLSLGVLTAQAAGKIEAGKPTSTAKPQEAWKDRGRIVGAARNAPPFTATVLDTSGKEVKTAQSGEPKDGRRGYELQWLEPGVYSLRVTAEGYDPLQLDKLEVRANQDVQVNLEFTPGAASAVPPSSQPASSPGQPATGKIEAGKPSSTAKPQEAWKDRGRIVGAARNAPAFTVTVLDGSGKEVKTIQAGEPKDGRRSYEVQWLEPGVYTLRIAAEGYAPLQLEKLEVRANQDLQVNLEFTK